VFEIKSLSSANLDKQDFSLVSREHISFCSGDDETPLQFDAAKTGVLGKKMKIVQIHRIPVNPKVFMTAPAPQ
jgi:hypothetical protein